MAKTKVDLSDQSQGALADTGLAVSYIKTDGTRNFGGNQSMSTLYKITNAANGSDPQDYVTKSQLDGVVGGLIWLPPILVVNLVDDVLQDPPLAPLHGDVHIAGDTPTGDWAGKPGHAFQWQTSMWVDLLNRAIATGDRFIVSGVTATVGAGGLLNKDNYIATVNSATPSFVTWTFQAPINGNAVYINTAGALFYGYQFQYDSTLNTWLQFGGTSALVAGTGLMIDGNVLSANLGAGITETPSDQIGIDLASGSGLELTTTIPAGNGQLQLTQAAKDALAHGETAYSHSTSVTGAEHGAVATNGANMIVRRGATGDFAAGTITAALTGAASLNVLKTGDTMSGALAMGNQNITGVASLGMTGARVTTGFFTDLAVTNTITGSVSGNAATVTTNANLSGPVTSVGNTTAIANGAISNAMLANGAVANLSGINTGDQTNITGNAGTATKLAAGVAINGISFDGSAAITTPLNTADDITIGTYYPVVASTSGNSPAKTSSTKLYFNASSGVLTATGFSGPLTGDVTGNCTGVAAGGTSGNAATSTKSDDVATATSVYPTWAVDTGSRADYMSKAKLSFVPSTGILTASGFSGPLTGTVTGSASLNLLKAGDTMTGNLILGANSVTMTTGNLSITGAGGVTTASGNLTATAGSLVAAGLQITGGTPGVSKVLASDAVGVATWTVTTLGRQIIREAITPVTPYTATSFTVQHPIIAGTEEIFINGVLAEPLGEDYTIDVPGSTGVRFAFAPKATDRIRINYLW